MKFSKIFFVILFSLFSFALKAQSSISEDLKKNPDFRKINEITQIFLSTFQKKIFSLPISERENLVKELEILSKKIENEKERYSFYEKMGFVSGKNAEALATEKKNALANLNKTYPELKEKNNEELVGIFRNAGFILTIIPSPPSEIIVPQGCQETYKACVELADADLYSMTVGCMATLLVPGWGTALGLACEATACYKHYSSVKACNAAAADCK